MSKSLLGVLAIGAVLTATGAPAATLVNGSFEDGPALNAEGYNRGGLPTGWSAVAGLETPDILGNAYNQVGAGFAQLLHAQDGNRYLDMNGFNPTGGIRQDVAGLAAGTQREMTFWSGSWAQNSSGSLTASLIDTATLAVLGTTTINIPYNPNATGSAWVQYTLSGVVGASGQVRVQFSGDSGSGARGAPGLDNVVLRAVPGAVPEPASWALMIGGFALAGGALRRRQAVRASLA